MYACMGSINARTAVEAAASIVAIATVNNRPVVARLKGYSYYLAQRLDSRL